MTNLSNSRFLTSFRDIPRIDKSDFFENMGSFCLKPIITVCGHTYSYKNEQYLLKSSSTQAKCLATAFLLIGIVSVPVTIIGFIATWLSNSHSQHFAHFKKAMQEQQTPTPTLSTPALAPPTPSLSTPTPAVLTPPSHATPPTSIPTTPSAALPPQSIVVNTTPEPQNVLGLTTQLINSINGFHTTLDKCSTDQEKRRLVNDEPEIVWRNFVTLYTKSKALTDAQKEEPYYSEYLKLEDKLYDLIKSYFTFFNSSHLREQGYSDAELRIILSDFLVCSNVKWAIAALFIHGFREVDYTIFKIVLETKFENQRDEILSSLWTGLKALFGQNTNDNAHVAKKVEIKGLFQKYISDVSLNTLPSNRFASLLCLVEGYSRNGREISFTLPTGFSLHCGQKAYNAGPHPLAEKDNPNEHLFLFYRYLNKQCGDEPSRKITLEDYFSALNEESFTSFFKALTAKNDPECKIIRDMLTYTKDSAKRKTLSAHTSSTIITSDVFAASDIPVQADILYRLLHGKTGKEKNELIRSLANTNSMSSRNRSSKILLKLFKEYTALNSPADAALKAKIKFILECNFNEHCPSSRLPLTGYNRDLLRVLLKDFSHCYSVKSVTHFIGANMDEASFDIYSILLETPLEAQSEENLRDLWNGLFTLFIRNWQSVGSKLREEDTQKYLDLFQTYINKTDLAKLPKERFATLLYFCEGAERPAEKSKFSFDLPPNFDRYMDEEVFLAKPEAKFFKTKSHFLLCIYKYLISIPDQETQKNKLDAFFASMSQETLKLFWSELSLKDDPDYIIGNEILQRYASDPSKMNELLKCKNIFRYLLNKSIDGKNIEDTNRLHLILDNMPDEQVRNTLLTFQEDSHFIVHLLDYLNTSNRSANVLDHLCISSVMICRNVYSSEFTSLKECISKVVDRDRKLDLMSSLYNSLQVNSLIEHIRNSLRNLPFFYNEVVFSNMTVNALIAENLVASKDRILDPAKFTSTVMSLPSPYLKAALILPLLNLTTNFKNGNINTKHEPLLRNLCEAIQANNDVKKLVAQNADEYAPIFACAKLLNLELV